MKGRLRAAAPAFVGLLAACLSVPPRTAPPPPVGRGSIIDTLAIRAHTSFLADDLLGGRGTGAPGADLAAAYITAQCRGLGLRPVGRDFVQEVPLVEAVVDSATLLVRTSGEVRRYAYPQEFLPDFGGERGLASFAGPAVYGGSPLALAELPEVRGAVVLTAAPVRDRALLDSLARRGAAGLLQIVPDSSVLDLYRTSRGASRMAIAEPGVATSLLPTMPWILGAPSVARDLALASIGPLSAELAVQLHVTNRTVAGRNVACLLPGSAAGVRDTAIVFTAHYDHLGVGAPDERGDSIYNGFSDNAAGVGMLLAIAQAMARGPAEPMRHSVIFLFPTAEERGLLGSDYYAAKPLWPLARTAGVINLDAGAPPAPPTSWRIPGGDRSALGALAMDVALTHGWSATTSPATPNSDYYPFARSGVPAIFIIPGPGPYEGLTSDSSIALRRTWDHYHQAGDAWAPDFPFRGLQRYAEYAYLVARALDRGGGLEERWPTRRP
ncbi:MAG: M28 family peptidase [Gemmatimonadetes bacterium]|nr:M28 family peptidase [Gemmatimonadota bacterium]